MTVEELKAEWAELKEAMNAYEDEQYRIDVCNFSYTYMSKLLAVVDAAMRRPHLDNPGKTHHDECHCCELDRALWNLLGEK